MPTQSSPCSMGKVMMEPAPAAQAKWTLFQYTRNAIFIANKNAIKTKVQQQQMLAQALQSSGYNAIGQGGIAGDFLRGFNQQKLDQEYADFMERENYDLRNLGILQSAVQNAPFQTSTSQSQSPDRAGQAIQIAGVAAAAF